MLISPTIMGVLSRSSMHTNGATIGMIASFW
jgi:hypothetical protein